MKFIDKLSYFIIICVTKICEHETEILECEAYRDVILEKSWQ